MTKEEIQLKLKHILVDLKAINNAEHIRVFSYRDLLKAINLLKSLEIFDPQDNE